MNGKIEIKVHRMHRLETSGALKAFVDISINDVILIKGVRLIDGKKGLFISMPSEKAKDDKWYENVRCLNNEVREQIAEEIISSYMAENAVN